jgi:hypothetical protein
MTILPILIFGSLSFLCMILYWVKNMFMLPLQLLGLWKQHPSMEPIRGRDPSGSKRARALQDALRPEKVLH